MSQGPSIGYATSALPSDLRYRSISPRDLEQIKSIHLRLFPVQYSDEFFERAVRGIGLYKLPLMSSIAYYKRPRQPAGGAGGALSKRQQPTASASSSTAASSAGGILRGLADLAGRSRVACSLPEGEDYDDYGHDEEEDDEEEVIVGFILSQLLGSDRCAEDVQEAIALPQDSALTALDPYGGGIHGGAVAYYGCYILTLGVLPEYRRGGLGQELVRQAIQAAAQATPKCAVVYLHVIHFNKPALRFYGERVGFTQVKYIDNFYVIDDQKHGAYVYMYYVNGYQPTTSLRVYMAISSAARQLSTWWGYLVAPILSLGSTSNASTSTSSTISNSNNDPAVVLASNSSGTTSTPSASSRCGALVWDEYMDERMERERRQKEAQQQHSNSNSNTTSSTSNNNEVFSNSDTRMSGVPSAQFNDAIV